MANRYWVGGTGTWDASDTSHWSASSGGGSGASVPTSSDNVYFDGNSGTGTASLQAAGDCLDLDCTGYTGTLTFNASLNFYGTTMKFVAGMTLNVNQYINGYSATTCTITSGGKNIRYLYLAYGLGSYALGDNLISDYSYFLTGLNTNNYNITGIHCQTQLTVTLGTSTIEVSNTFWNGAGGTFSAASSTIKLAAVTVGDATFYGNGGTFGTVWFYGDQQASINIYGSNTYSLFKATTPGSSYDLKITSGTTQTSTTWDVSGTGCYNQVRIKSSTGGSIAALSDSAGTNTFTYVSLKDITASGGATWNAVSARNISNNSGWNYSGTACVYNRYWVGGTDTWNGTAGSKWSETSGGASGAAAPVQDDDVFFDANSGAGTTTLGSAVNVGSLTFTGYTGTFTGSSALNLYGNMVMVAGMTMTYTGDVTPIANSTITSAGKTIGNFYNTSASGAIVITITDALNVLRYYQSGGATIVHGGNAVNAEAMYIFGTNSSNSGSGIWNITGYDNGPYASGYEAVRFDYVQWNAGTMVINMTNTSNNTVSFVGGYYGETYNKFYNVNFTRGSSTGDNKVVGAPQYGNTEFNAFTDTGTAAHNLIFTSALTYEFTSFAIGNAGGSCANKVTLKSSSAGSAVTLTDTTGTNTSNYVAVKDIAGTGGATWSFVNYADMGGNSGLSFSGSVCPTTLIKVFQGLVNGSTKTTQGLTRASVKTAQALA